MPPNYEQYISYAYQRCTHSSRRVNEYTTEFLRLAERNQLPKVRTNSRLYKRRERTF